MNESRIPNTGAGGNMDSGELKHIVYIKNRNKIEMTGIYDVSGFDETSIIADSCEGSIAIEGKDFKITKFDSESGELEIEGVITSLIYYSKSPDKKKGMFSGLFK